MFSVPGLIQGVSLGTYQGGLREAVLSLKFRHARILGRSLGELLAQRAAQMSWEIDAVVPVPMARRRRRARLFNPAHVIARHAAKFLNRPCLDVLCARAGLAHQVGLGEKERRQNVRGAFTLRPDLRLENQTVLLIDDVSTTGATLAECAAALHAAGPRKIYAAAAAVETREVK